MRKIREITAYKVIGWQDMLTSKTRNKAIHDKSNNKEFIIPSVSVIVDFSGIQTVVYIVVIRNESIPLL